MANPDHLAILQDALDKKDISIWNDWRKQHETLKPDLSRADLHESNLVRANLFDTNLSSTNLRGAHLIGVDLNRANLSSANLSGANLFRVNLRGADLNRANLSSANLSGANLIEAYLAEVDFESTIFLWTQFDNVDLSTAKNLDKASVRGSCTIGIDTLYKSGGNIPESFLVKCGVPDEIIEYTVNLRSTTQYHKPFISYSHDNMIFVDRLHSTLEKKGLRCWRDKTDVEGG